MSTWANRARARLLREDPAAGFTLIEVIVALVVVALAATALAALLVSGARASQFARLNTLGKNLTQARIEAMRSLPFHVAFQNGPFVDLLDDYYHNVLTTATSITPTGGTGTWVQAGTGAGGTPTGPYYKVTFTSASNPANGSVTLPDGFTQEVDAQFLVPNSNPRKPVAAAKLTNFIGGQAYNSQAAQFDQPPSLLLGLTVTTAWSDHGATKSNHVYTEISDTGRDAALVTVQAGATALRLTSADASGNAMQGLLAQLGINASLSTGSTASATADAARLTRTDGNGNDLGHAFGAASSAVAPPDSMSPVSATAQQTDATQPPCGWGSFGPTQTSDVSATVADAQPRAPKDVESTSPTPTVGAALKANSGGACSGFSFTNVLSGSSADDTLGLTAGAPIVALADTTGSGTLVGATGYADTPALPFTGTKVPATSMASVAFNQTIQLFPSLALAGGNPLVKVNLTRATISCTAGQAATASYSGSISYWTWSSSGSKYTTVPLNWPSSTPALPDPASIVVGQDSNGLGITLATYISSWSLADSIVEQSQPGGVGLHVIPNVLTITTAPILGSSRPESAVDLGIGNLSCVAEDNR